MTDTPQSVSLVTEDESQYHMMQALVRSLQDATEAFKRAGEVLESYRREVLEEKFGYTVGSVVFVYTSIGKSGLKWQICKLTGLIPDEEDPFKIAAVEVRPQVNGGSWSAKRRFITDWVGKIKLENPCDF